MKLLLILTALVVFQNCSKKVEEEAADEKSKCSILLSKAECDEYLKRTAK